VELYDLKKDPQQTKNVAEEAAYRDIAAMLDKRLMTELAQTGDPRLIDEGVFYETPPMAGPLPENGPQNVKRKKKR
jgi:hypothetical protein